MAWEIVKRTATYIMWQSRDAEERRIYAATAEAREPLAGLYSQKAALGQLEDNFAEADIPDTYELDY